MPTRSSHLAISAAPNQLALALAELQKKLELPGDFTAEALNEAKTANPETPDLDLRDIPFATLDPAGSRDLDQAFHLEKIRGGWQVRYAIADVPGFIAPGGALDQSSRERGQTYYAVDGTIPLHPVLLSENRVSLLPGQDRTAFVWTFRLDDRGAVTDRRVERAQVRSRMQLDYVTTQAALDAGEIDSPAALLPAIGTARIEQERLRGGASLDIPDEEVLRNEDGTYRLVRRTPLPIENWNAQLSLMTGMAAADIMLSGGLGVLRTMPAPSRETLDAFRIRVTTLGKAWPAEQPYGEYLRTLDHTDPVTPAILQAAASLFRGAGYTVFDGTAPTDIIQAAVAAPYAHVTAPLRRLVDRWGLVICAALVAGGAVPGWVKDSLAQLPELMAASMRRASNLEHESIDRVEAALLSASIGEVFTATVIEAKGDRVVFQLAEPAVTASCSMAGAIPGSSFKARLDAADIASGKIAFSAVA